MIQKLYRKSKNTFHRVTKRQFINLANHAKTYLKKENRKVFGIGRNKTGTTSLKIAMQKMGYVVGDQRSAEMLMDKWAEGDYRPIINYCKTAEFFQDVPFSLPNTFKVLDKEFPGSKFILTVRDSPEQWYNSLINFHAKLWGKDGRVPTKEDLINTKFIYKGRAWRMNRFLYNSPEEDPYKKEVLIQHYIDYNDEVKSYFEERPDDLLVLNVAEEGGMKKLAKFLNKEVISEEFPWENKTWKPEE